MNKDVAIDNWVQWIRSSATFFQSFILWVTIQWQYWTPNFRKDCYCDFSDNNYNYESYRTIPFSHRSWCFWFPWQCFGLFFSFFFRFLAIIDHWRLISGWRSRRRIAVNRKGLIQVSCPRNDIACVFCCAWNTVGKKRMSLVRASRRTGPFVAIIMWGESMFVWYNLHAFCFLASMGIGQGTKITKVIVMFALPIHLTRSICGPHLHRFDVVKMIQRCQW